MGEPSFNTIILESGVFNNNSIISSDLYLEECIDNNGYLTLLGISIKICIWKHVTPELSWASPSDIC